MLFQKRSSAGYLAARLGRLFAKALHARIAPLGLAPAPFMVLIELAREGGLTQRDLVERLDVEQGTMTATLARMQRDGLIRRRPHPDDGRAHRLWLTAKAKELVTPAAEAAMAVNVEALGALSAQERETFLRLAQRILDGFQDRATPDRAER